jgi:hypothetical protein
VDNESVAAVEVDELVLASTFDATYAPALCQTRSRWRELALERRMNCTNRGNRLPYCGSRESSRGALYFR